MDGERYYCPCCGYHGLHEPAYSEMPPTPFGYDDDPRGQRPGVLLRPVPSGARESADGVVPFGPATGRVVAGSTVAGGWYPPRRTAGRCFRPCLIGCSQTMAPPGGPAELYL